MEKRKNVDLTQSDNVINDEWLLDKYKLITRTEYEEIYPEGNYENYRHILYKEGITAFYCRFKRAEWFISRFIAKERINDDFDNLENWYVMNNIDRNARLTEICRRYKENDNVEKIILRQNNDLEKFERDIFLKTTTPDNFRGLAKVKVNEFTEGYFISPLKLQKLYKSLQFLYKTNLETEVNQIFDEFELTRKLREDFLFCTTCCVKSDSKLEMLERCSYHNINNVNNRRIDLICEIPTVNFKKILQEISDECLTKLISKTENVFECKECHKQFNTKETVQSHLFKKHEEITDHIKLSQESYKKLVDGLDLTALGWIEDSSREIKRPFFTYPKLPRNNVIYDIKNYY
ncbi:hypothetical protein NUSPORA_00114 [Nucleospora cyclopteri]